MLSFTSKKRLAGAFAILSLAFLTVGCEDDYDHHRPPRRTERPDHDGGRDDHRRHPDRDHRDHDHRRRDENDRRQRDENERRQRDENDRRHRNDGQGHRDHRRHREDGNNQYRRRPASAFVGAYSARALNDVVVAKGNTFPLDVVQTGTDSLALILPSGKQYPIRLDEETGAGVIAGGSLSQREDGLFVYEDAKGGLWLIEKE